jgi:hypothetical protein
MSLPSCCSPRPQSRPRCRRNIAGQWCGIDEDRYRRCKDPHMTITRDRVEDCAVTAVTPAKPKGHRISLNCPDPNPSEGTTLWIDARGRLVVIEHY